MFEDSSYEDDLIPQEPFCLVTTHMGVIIRTLHPTLVIPLVFSLLQSSLLTTNKSY